MELLGKLRGHLGARRQHGNEINRLVGIYMIYEQKHKNDTYDAPTDRSNSEALKDQSREYSLRAKDICSTNSCRGIIYCTRCRRCPGLAAGISSF
jgi:hypothetical protein